MNNNDLIDQKSTLPSFEHLEKADYLVFDQEQLYYVLHSTELPLRARVLLAGPFASERSQSYISWVRWARYLASQGFEVLRFDYRGVGESTGRFEDFGLRAWADDLLHCADWLQQRSPSVPLIIHGLGMGALLGDRLYAQGIGDVLLSWLPPKSAREMLYEQLKIKLSNNFSLPSSERKTREQFIADLENGEIVEVEGNNWTSRLWSEAAEFVFSENIPSDQTMGSSKRTRHIAELDPLTAHILGGVGHNPLRAQGRVRLLNPDLTRCFNTTTDWLNHTLAKLKVNQNA
jgi:hypothetical protein